MYILAAMFSYQNEFLKWDCGSQGLYILQFDVCPAVLDEGDSMRLDGHGPLMPECPQPYCGQLSLQAPRKHCVAFDVHKMSHESLPAFGNFKVGLIPALRKFFEAGDLEAKQTS